MKRILVLSMGGTIDSAAYPAAPGAYPAHSTPDDENRAFRIISAFPDTQAAQVRICNKDSKALDARDKNALLEHIRSAQGYDRLIVTMGTDTMVETAQWIESRIPEASCPVVFTGAIWPLANGPDVSDGHKNLHMAVFGNDKTSGGRVYIAMGDVFAPAERVRKHSAGGHSYFHLIPAAQDR